MELKKLPQPVILNAKGEPIRLNAQEQYKADLAQKQMNEVHNSLGYEISITTLTAIAKKVSEQKFFTAAPADYLPVRVGQGAWSDFITTYRSFQLADAFETGILQTGDGNARLATADAGVDALNINVYNWGKTVGWTIIQLQQASMSGNWDVVAAKEKARKKNWDLGVQKIAFLGAQGLTAGGSCLGLLNQAGITVNTSVIAQAISTMTTAQLKSLVATIMNAYRANNNRTAWPTHFIMPESDFLGCATQVSPDFPIKTILELLEEAFRVTTGNKQFKVLPLAYCDEAYSGFSYQQYVLLNYDEESLRMDVPVDYTNTLANSVDNFSFQNVGYGQFTGVLAYRPLELMYFQYS